MTPALFLAVCGAGGLGASARMFIDGVLNGHRTARIPFATAVINLTGSFALGLLTGLAGAHLLSAAWLSVLGTGFLGGYTTFSTASVETVRLLRAKRFGAGLVHALGMLAGGLACAGLGLALGSAL